ncbi:MAG: efflux RND transporter permease subunit [Bacteroidales bacterium]|nr:efflux RND transporter permease subunit [Bacteroidales bacterium]
MKGIPNFSIVLFFIAAMVVGAGVIPLMEFQYSPSAKTDEISVYTGWRNASAESVEREVTSRIEGLASSISGVRSVTSTSVNGLSTVTVSVKNKKNIPTIRFELISRLKEIYEKLPQGVSYPNVSGRPSGKDSRPIMSYRVKSAVALHKVEPFLREKIVEPLSLLNGVGQVTLSGIRNSTVNISFKPELLSAYGLSESELVQTIKVATGQDVSLGLYNGIPVVFCVADDASAFEQIPIKTVGGRIIRLGDIANIALRENQQDYFFRINGLEYVTITIFASPDENIIPICKSVKKYMAETESSFPYYLSLEVVSDESSSIEAELKTVLRRITLCILLLLAFVYLTSRNLKYLIIVFASLLANILIACIFYVLLGLEIHIYSLAGITVSLGIIIDTTIVMIAHYGYYKNRKAFIAILAAQATSIGAMSVIFLLPSAERVNLNDFAAVVIINLAVSLLIAFLLIPALSDILGVTTAFSKTPINRKRRIIRANEVYGQYITKAKPYRWVLIVLIIVSFGLPVEKLPDRIRLSQNEGENRVKTAAVNAYNATLGSSFFVHHLKRPLSVLLGGTFRLYLNKKPLKTETDVEPTLVIKGSLPEGCTVQQLNQVVQSMENYLAQFDEIDRFSSAVTSHKDGYITVSFKPEAIHSAFPAWLKNAVIQKAIDFGGATWSVWGVTEKSFSNNIGLSDNRSSITMTGYNYKELIRYCQDCLQSISKNPNVSRVDVGLQNMSLAATEFYMTYDDYLLAAAEMTKSDVHEILQRQIFDSHVGNVGSADGVIEIRASAETGTSFDVWNMANEYYSSGDRLVKLSGVGEINKHGGGYTIFKRNQSYELGVLYEYLGASRAEAKMREAEIRRLKEEVLPLGYDVSDGFRYSSGSIKTKVHLILISIVIIYFICAILFESFVAPLLIITLIPISFVGVFLFFTIFKCDLDAGGYASLIMLAGLVVNAGIYLLKEYDGQLTGGGNFLKAFNRKIIPISLTVLSTIFGFLPFLIDGKSAGFWFSFALGTTGGLLFSVVGLVLILPVFIKDIQLK